MSPSDYIRMAVIVHSQLSCIREGDDCAPLILRCVSSKLGSSLVSGMSQEER